MANLALEVSGVDVGAPTHEFLAKSLKDAYNPTIARIRTMLHDFRDRIMLPVDVALNVGNNRIEVPVRDLPVEAPCGTSASNRFVPSLEPSERPGRSS